MTQEPDYLANDLHKAFAEDPSLGELGVEVEVDHDVIRLTGTVATEEHRRRLIEKTEGRYPGYSIDDQIRLADMGEAPRREP